MEDCLMIKSNTPLTCFLFFLIVFLITMQSVEATATNFTVHRGDEKTRVLNLAVEDRVLIEFTVVGTLDHTLHFSVSYPNGTVKDFGKIGNLRHSFVCDVEGECVLHFSNTDSTEDKLVTLNYEIQHYIFGIPQMLFLALIIAIICVAAVAVFVLMGKPR